MKRITFPGLIDPHVHLRDPGQTEKEDFFTGTAAALAGGYTAVVDMPNNLEPIFTVKALQKKKRIAKKAIVANLGFYFGSLGDNLAEFEPAMKQNVKGLKIYLNHTTGNFLINKKVLHKIFKAWPEQLPILVHAEGEMFDAVIQEMKRTPRRVHLCHISTRYELERVIEAKTTGLPVTCGVTPHHLFLSRGDEKSLGPWAKMRPPLESKATVQFLWKHLRAIDCIESDHAPHTVAEKQQTDPPNGVPGLETTLPLLLTAVSEGRIELYDIIRLCHDGPARIFNIRQAKGTYVEVDLEAKHVLSNSTLLTKAGWSPFDGWHVVGKVRRTYIREQKVYEDGHILAPRGFGTVI